MQPSILIGISAWASSFRKDKQSYLPPKKLLIILRAQDTVIIDTYSPTRSAIVAVAVVCHCDSREL